VQVQHRLAEVLANGPIQPPGAENRGAPGAEQVDHSRFPGGLAPAIDPQGVGGLLWPVGVALGAVEDEVRADLEQAPSGRGKGLGKGPGGAGMVPGLWMFNRAFIAGEFGYACALGLCLFVVILGMTFINNKFLRVEK
jgi:hypothetical protein